MSTAPFPVSPELTSIAIAYRNPQASLIADAVMPRCRKAVGKREFKYHVYGLEAFGRPDTRVGRTSSPNQVSWEAREETASVQDYALDDPIPQDDLDQGGKDGINVKGLSVEYIMDLLRLDRECRVAGLVQDPANYAHSLTLSGTDQFSDAVNSDPLGLLLTALDTPIVRPNSIILGQKVWGVLRTHPQIVKALYPNANGGGMVTKEQFRELLELDEINIGTSFVNNARKGQTPVMSRTWGPHIALHYRNRNADTQRGITWGLTVPYGKPVAGSKADPDIGMRGGQKVRAGESLKELVLAPEAGYLIQNAVAG